MTPTRAVPPHELTPAQIQHWRELLLVDDQLASPYFRPEYVQAVAEVRDDVFVAVLKAGGEEAYLPFQRGRLGMAGPVGGGLNDYQAVIAPPGFPIEPERIVSDLGLRLLDFDHQLAHQTAFAPYVTVNHSSPYLDLSNGFDGYVQARKAAGSSRLSQFQRKGRKLGREVGDVRLVYSESDDAILDQVIAWKRDQCKRTGAKDFLGWGWTTDIIEQIHRTKTDGFAGILTALYAGDQLVAAHFGMRTERVLHWWFPTYDPEYGQYSPGGVLLTMLAERAAGEGIVMLDLGRGGEGGYKSSFATDAIDLVEGVVAPPSVVANGRAALRRADDIARNAEALEPLRGVARKVKHRLRN